MNSTVRSKNGSTKSADNCLPRFPVERHVAKPCTSFHISYTCPSATPRAKPCRRFTFAHFLRLINQKTEAYHDFSSSFSTWLAQGELNSSVPLNSYMQHLAVKNRKERQGSYFDRWVWGADIYRRRGRGGEGES